MAEYKAKLLNGPFTQAKNVQLSDGTTVDSKLSETTSGWTRLSEYVYYRKIGNQVWVRTSVPNSVIAGGAWTGFGTLPSGVRPAQQINMCLHYDSTPSFQDVQIETGGACKFRGNITVYGLITFLID